MKEGTRAGKPQFAIVLTGAAAVVSAGCHPRPKPVLLDAIPMRDAVRIVNENTARIAGTLKATGFVDGRATLPDGRTGSYHLDGTLFYLAPNFVRFDLKSFGDRKFLLGSNAEQYWYYDREADEYRCGRHGEDGELPPELPIPPEQIVDAMGLTPIGNGEPSTGRPGPVHRIVAEYQQILFLARDEQGNLALVKEYWLDRYPPRLVRRVVFRDADGAVELESKLGDYRALSPDGPMLPHDMIARWPKKASHMRFRVGRWKSVESVGPKSVQFAAPRECTE